jgi:hypothetical protein
MEDGPFSDPGFVPFAAQLVLVRRDTMAPKPAASILDRVELPCSGVGIFDPDGNLLARPLHALAAIQAACRTAGEVFTLRRLGASRTAGENKRLFLAEVELDLVPPATLAARAAALSLDAEERSRVAALVVDAELQCLFARLHEIGPAAIGREVASLVRRERLPSPRMQQGFWLQALQHAAATSDANLGRQAHAALVGAVPAVEPARAAVWRELLERAVRADPPARAAAVQPLELPTEPPARRRC